jgi:hypothetical protein
MELLLLRELRLEPELLLLELGLPMAGCEAVLVSGIETQILIYFHRDGFFLPPPTFVLFVFALCLFLPKIIERNQNRAGFV